jgi:monofunctional glycosyltransferase
MTQRNDQPPFRDDPPTGRPPGSVAGPFRAPDEDTTVPASQPATVRVDDRDRPPRSQVLYWVRRVAKWAFVGALAYGATIVALIVLYRWVNPPASTLMILQRVTGTKIDRAWMPLDRISPNLVRAVIMSEDAGFCSHRGVDWRELKDVIEAYSEGGGRGGSTISMQLSKNLFLWPGRSFIRKAVEIPVTLGMELVLPKPRILELYLNIAEWGPGVFGAEAAAQYHFGKSALDLDEGEAALLAVTLPAPIARDAGDPSRRLERLANVIRGRMRASAQNTRCVLPRVGRTG